MVSDQGLWFVTYQAVLVIIQKQAVKWTYPNDVLLFVCSKMADETNLSSKLPVADRTREV